MEINEQRLQTSTSYKCSNKISWNEDTYCFSSSLPTILGKNDVLKFFLKQRDEHQFKILSTTIASLHLDLSQHIKYQESVYVLNAWFRMQLDEKKLKSEALAIFESF